ncbi:hypothetical protein CTAYLR_006979 [Chrysophaeum taylorii]|uniref:Uncharacterized protein n=1 Tax=Chrysophaeum taylorii TaxID=2483200 RepID=A0AAD7UC10_9STRA|nr:hypothetical protein CTAYLR_006979 [Chrysophaeum taylorii]
MCVIPGASKDFPAQLSARAATTPDATVARVWTYGKGVETIWSYAGLETAVAYQSRILWSIFGDVKRIAFLAKGNMDFFVALVAVQRICAAPVILNWRQPTATLVGGVSDAGCGALIVGAPYHEIAKAFSVPVLKLADTTVVTPPPSEQRCASTPEDIALVLFTSGSTSRPKPVAHTNATLMWTVQNFVFPTEEMRSTLCFLPNFHVLMTFQNFLLPLARGVGVATLGDAETPVTAALLLAACGDLEPTTVDTVPFIMQDLSTFSVEELAPMAACAAVRSGGAPLPAAVARRLASAGVRVQTHYGQTEAPGMQLLTVPGAAPDELAIMMPPWHQVVEVALSDDGELLLGGCGGSSPGYLRDGALVPGKCGADGWHRTGDIFSWTTTGGGTKGLRFMMRRDDTLLLSTGEMINPLAYEAQLAEALLGTPEVSAFVLLGQQRARPVLVAELLGSATQRTKDHLRRAVDDVNARQPEYGRAARVATLEPDRGDPALPKSVKGVVIRAKAETLLAHRLDDADDDLLEGDEEKKETIAYWPTEWIWPRKAWSHKGGDRSLRVQVARYLESGKNAADLTSALGLDSLTAARLVSQWRAKRDSKKNAERPMLERFKAMLCERRDPAGRPLTAILRNELTIRYYRVLGYYEGMECTFDWGLPPIDDAADRKSGRRVQQTVLVSHELPNRKMHVRVWHDEEWHGPARPCLLAINGDAFFGYAETRPIPYRLVKLGYVIAQAERRGSHEGGTFPNALHDIAAAIRVLKGNAATLNVDPDRICAFGDSSGGWFSSMIGALSGYEEDPTLKRELLGDLGDFPHLSTDVSCVVALFPPSRFDMLDEMLARERRWLFAEAHDEDSSPESLFMGHGLQVNPDRLRKATPATFITKATPPFWLTHGTADPQVALEQTQTLYAQLLAARPPGETGYHEYVEIPGGGHGTYHFTDKVLGIENHLLRYLRARLDPPAVDDV